GRGTASAAAWTGSLIALAGVGLIAGGGGSGTSLMGDLLVLASVSGSAAVIVVQPRLLAGRDAGAGAAVHLGAGGVFSLPSARLHGLPAAPPSATPIVAVILLALTGTALAFWLFAWGQGHVSPEVAGAFVNLEPLVGAATGAVVFHDIVGGVQMLGGTAILVGIALGALPRRSPVERPAVAEEPARRTVVRERRGPHDAARPVAHRPASRAAHVRRHPTA